MNKLGFTITRTYQGVAKLIECNKDHWASKVVDVRDYLKLFSGLQGTDNSITFISFDEEGCFLNQLRAISGRAGDNLCGWIYIPNTIEITSEEIMEAYNFVEKILSQSNINDSKEEIEVFFSKEYHPKKYIFKYAPSSGEKYGVRNIGRYYSKKEILGENCYQQYYSGYKAIFLVDPKGDVQPLNEQMFVDLTKEEIREVCIFLPPSEDELKKGTKIKFKNGSEFNSPIQTYKNGKIELSLTREGFEPVKRSVTIHEDGQKLELGSQSIEWKKTVKRSMFKFFDLDDHKHAEIKEYIRIFINGTELTEQGLSISEKDCKCAKVEIHAPGYEILKRTENLLNDRHEIKLCRKEKSYEYSIQLINGKEGRMIIESKYLPPKEESPLQGYDYDRRVLKLSSSFIYKQRFLGFVQGLGALFLIYACFFIYSWINEGFPLPFINKEKTSAAIEVNNDSTEKKQDAKETSYQLADAIKYLDNNTVWDKSVMEKYPDLQGLFDAMNEFRLEELTNGWASKLNDSKNFQKVCESAQKNLDKSWNPKQGTHQPTYNKPSDGQINLTNYINWLSQDQTPQAPTQNEGFHPEAPVTKAKTGSNNDNGNNPGQNSKDNSKKSGKKTSVTDTGNRGGL